jgi:hypothetical protein
MITNVATLQNWKKKNLDYGCDHNQMNQNDKGFIEDYDIFCGDFQFFIGLIFWMNFLQYVTKINIISSIHHIFKIKNWWITKNIF